eukprot:m.305525 g.305525  ORF g.305525 m.305525 type:complete len:1554 (+) comp16341_c0_seq2:444-5105(+)
MTAMGPNEEDTLDAGGPAEPWHGHQPEEVQLLPWGLLKMVQEDRLPLLLAIDIFHVFQAEQADLAAAVLEAEQRDFVRPILVEAATQTRPDDAHAMTDWRPLIAQPLTPPTPLTEAAGLRGRQPSTPDSSIADGGRLHTSRSARNNQDDDGAANPSDACNNCGHPLTPPCSSSGRTDSSAKRSKKRKIHSADTGTRIDIRPSDVFNFFLVAGMSTDDRFRADIAAHVERFGQQNDYAGFKDFVKTVNNIVKAFAKRFAKQLKQKHKDVPVAKTLNKVRLYTTSDATIEPASFYCKMYQQTPFRGLQDGTAIDETTQTPLFDWIVKEFVNLMDKFKINGTDTPADVVQFATEYFFPDGRTDLFTEIHSTCGIPRIGEVEVVENDAGAGPAETAAEPEQVTDQPAAVGDRAASTAMEVEPTESPSHAEVYDLHFHCVEFLGVIPKVTLELASLNCTSGVDLVQTQRHKHARWSVVGLHKVVEEEGGVFIPTGPDLSESTEVLGEGHLMLIVKKNHEIPDDGNGVGEHSGPADGGHNGGHPDGDFSKPMDEDPPPDPGSEGGSPPASPSNGSDGGGLGGGGNNSFRSINHCDSLSEPNSDCSEGQLSPTTVRAFSLPRQASDLVTPRPARPVVGYDGAISQEAQAIHATVALRSHHDRLAQPLQARCLETRRLRLLDFMQRDAGVSFALLFPFSVLQRLTCLSRPGQPLPMPDAHIEMWKRQLVSAASFLQPIPQLFRQSKILIVGSPLRICIAAGHVTLIQAPAMEATQPPTTTHPKQPVWANTFDEVMRGLANNTVTQAALTSLTPEQVGLLAAALTLNTSLIVLNLDTNQIGEVGAKELAVALEFNRTLKDLNLDYANVGDGGVVFIARALNHNASLERLHLDGNKIGDVGAKSLASALLSNRTLERLYLGENQIENDGATSLGEALATNQRLSRLYLNSNRIKDDGAIAIGVHCVQNCSLDKLRLDGNVDLTLEAAQAVQDSNLSLTVIFMAASPPLNQTVFTRVTTTHKRVDPLPVYFEGSIGEETARLPLDTIHDDALVEVCTWLRGIDLIRLAQTCRKYRTFVDQLILKEHWTSTAHCDFDRTLVTLAVKWQAEAVAAAEMAHSATEGLPLFRRAYSMNAVRNGVLSECPRDEDRRGPGGIEGHSLATWRDRWIICAGGYTQDEVDGTVYAMDTQGLAEGHACRWEPVVITGVATDRPEPSYGYSLTEVSGDRFVKYGGVLFAGYKNSVNSCHVLHLSLIGGKVQGRWEKLKDPSVDPSINESDSPSRHKAAYHGAVAVGPDRNSLLIYGGMDEGQAVAEATVIDIMTGVSFHPKQMAEHKASFPRGRYGAAVQAIGSTLWVIGGCNGGDLRREGHDFHDVHAADISALLEEHRLVWRAHDRPIEVPIYSTGREMASAVWGSKILLHGGTCDKAPEVITTELGNRISWFDTERLTFGQPKIVGHCEPTAALSVEAVVIGSRLYIHGGWCRQGLIDSLLQLQLGYEDAELPDLKEVQRRIITNKRLAEMHMTDTEATPHDGASLGPDGDGDALSQLIHNVLGELGDEEEA